MINHRGYFSPEFCEILRDFIKPLFEGIQASPQGRAVKHDVIASGLPRVAFEHPLKAGWLPPESHGQGFERAAATTPLHGVPLDLPHDSRRHMRTLRKLTLTPAQLAYTVTDSPSDRSPVLWIAFQDAFLRAPLPALRLADRKPVPNRA
jgi:hypothetical protein